MLPRPKSRETEEDLLKFQEEFLKDSSKTAAVAVLRVDKRKTQDDGMVGSLVNETDSLDDLESMETEANDACNSRAFHTNKKVKFGQDEEIRETVSSTNILEEVVLKDIVERDTRSWKASLPSAQRGQAFPKVFRRDKKLTNANTQQPMSIFAQQMRAFKEKKEEQNRKISKVAENSDSTRHINKIEVATDLTAVLGNTSVMVDGTGLKGDSDKQSLVREIHEENLTKLANMSPEEILKEQQQLLGMLNPNIVQFLKSKRNRLTSSENVSTPKKEVAPVTKNDSSKMESIQTSTSLIPNTEQSVKMAVTAESRPMEIESLQSESFNNKIVPSKVVATETRIPVQEAKKWPHMNKLEVEKLAWTTNLPKPEPIDPKSGYPARFDFDGVLVLRDADIPTHRGLHHHGDEPEIPGYTLEELFMYGRSAVLQQRTLALTTLAKILAKCKDGWYDNVLSEPLLPQLLDSGLILLLRWALDDNNEGSLSAALAALHALVVSVPDEICLERTSLWFRGEEVPFLQPEVVDRSETRDAKRQNNAREDELTDAELVKLDVIKGLIRMDVLHRLRYVLEVIRPPANVVVQILEILTRIASHSLDSAFAVTRCPRLLPSIVTEFLPKAWSSAAEEQSIPGKLTFVYGVPLPQAVKLIRTLANAGRHIAEDLLHRYDIMSSLLCYASIDPAEGYLPTKEALTLCLASYNTWRTFLHYGLTVQHYLDFYPLITKQLQFYQTLCVNMDMGKNVYNYDHAATLLLLLTTTLKLTLMKSTFELQSGPLLEWAKVEGLFVTVDLCVKKWLWELARADKITHSASRLVGAAVNFVTEFYNISIKQVTCNTTEILDRIEKFYDSSLIPFMESKAFDNLLTYLRQFSLFLCRTSSGKRRDPSMLPSLGSILWGGKLSPILEEMSSCAFLTHLMHCLYICNHIHGGLSSKIESLLLDNHDVIALLRQLVLGQTIASTDTNWFLRYESHFIYYLLMVCVLKKCSHPRVYHEAALQLLPKLQRGDEGMVHTLMEVVIFNAKFIRECDDITTILEELKLKDSDSLLGPTSEELEISTMKLLQHTFLCLPSICSTYQTYFAKYTNTQKLTRWNKLDSIAVPHIFVPPVPADLAYLPITLLHEMTTAHNIATVSSDQDVEAAVIHCLQWCHFLECWRKDIICTTASGGRFCSLAKVFLISSDLFLHSTIRSYLEGCLRKMAERNELTDLKWSKNSVPGFTSFYDLYIQLLEQFEASSYGDHLFGMLILIPLQRHHEVQLRRAIWTEHSNAARILGVSVKELLVPLQSFLFPIEGDSEMLLSYFKALINGYVQQKWCPVLYVIAIHHLHHFLFNKSMKELHGVLRRQIFCKIREIRHQAMATHLLGYVAPNADSELGFVYSEEPSEAVNMVVEHA